MGFSFFSGKHKKPAAKAYSGTPVIRCSICTGEQVAGFRDDTTGRIEEVMLLRSPDDLVRFKEEYGISGEIEKIY